MLQIQGFTGASNPCSEDPYLRCIVTGVTADERANAERMKVIGKEIRNGHDR